VLLVTKRKKGLLLIILLLLILYYDPSIFYYYFYPSLSVSFYFCFAAPVLIGVPVHLCLFNRLLLQQTLRFNSRSHENY
jgi:hypothetical protein